MADGENDKAEGAAEPDHALHKPEVSGSDAQASDVARQDADAAGSPLHEASRHDAPGPAGPARPHLEWTVSDRRGPLDSAETRSEADVERFVPAHETDAVGTADHASAPHDPEDALRDPVPPSPSPEPPPISDEPGRVAHSAAVEAAPSRSSAWPIAAGLIGGAVIGAAVAALIFNAQKPEPGSDQQAVALSSRVDALEKRPNPAQALSTLQGSVGDLYNKIAALQKAGPPSSAEKVASASPPDNGPLQKKVADLATSLDGLQGQTKDLQKQAADLQKQATETQGLAGKVTSLETAVSGAQKQTSTLQSNVEAVQAQQKSLEGKIGIPALAVVTDSLVQQIDHGEPFVTHVDALSTLGADPAKVAVLRQYADKGVPSAATLAAKFAPLAEPMVAAPHRAPPNAGLMDRLKSGMSGLVTVRSADTATGNDLSSRVARIETALSHDDVTAAYESWNLLPAEAKAKSEAWGALAKTSAVARAAARSLQREAIVSLGVKKS